MAQSSMNAPGSARRTHYEVLGVDRNAEIQSIANAYVDQVTRFNPALHPGNAAIERRHERIRSAWTTLSDPATRSAYDRTLDGSSGFTHNPSLEQWFGSRGRTGLWDTESKQTSFTMAVTLEELAMGATRKIRVRRDRPCSACEATGSQGGLVLACEACNGSGIITTRRTVGVGMEQTIDGRCTACDGTRIRIPDPCARCPQCQGRRLVQEKAVIEVNIEPGMVAGDKIKLEGEGDADLDLVFVDIVITLKEKPHAMWRRVGLNVHGIVELTLAEALLGFERSVQVLDGSTVELRSQPGEVYHNGTKRVVLGKGFPRRRKDGSGGGSDAAGSGQGGGERERQGNLVVEFAVKQLPLSEQQRQGLRAVFPEWSSLPEAPEFDGADLLQYDPSVHALDLEVVSDDEKRVSNEARRPSISHQPYLSCHKGPDKRLKVLHMEGVDSTLEGDRSPCCPRVLVAGEQSSPHNDGSPPCASAAVPAAVEVEHAAPSGAKDDDTHGAGGGSQAGGDAEDDSSDRGGEENVIAEDVACGTCSLARAVPRIPMYAPYNRRGLELGREYRWCSCGRSSSQPFCDDSCVEYRTEIISDDGTPVTCRFHPVSFNAPNTRLVSLCGCKYTRSPPYCDGVHATMAANPQQGPCVCKGRNDSLEW